MIKRWLIRASLVALVLLSTYLWIASYLRMAEVCYVADTTFSVVGTECGECYFSRFDTAFGPRRTWHWSDRPANYPEFQAVLRAQKYRFLGFACNSDLLPFAAWDIMIPLWFPTLCSLLLLLFAWRKTRPRLPAKAFPIEPTAKPGESKP